MRDYNAVRQPPEIEQAMLTDSGFPVTYHPCNHMERIRFSVVFGETLFANSAAGVFSAFASNAAGSSQFYVRDVPVNAVRYAYAGQVGGTFEEQGTFSVGRVRGAKVNDGTYNTPGFRQGFNGLVSEIVVFSSDQQRRATALGESSTFYFLDNTDVRLATLA